MSVFFFEISIIVKEKLFIFFFCISLTDSLLSLYKKIIFLKPLYMFYKTFFLI